MKKKLSIEGMSCGHCVNHVKAALVELSGVTNVEVSLTDKTAVFEVAREISDEDVKAAIDDAGYSVVQIETL